MINKINYSNLRLKNIFPKYKCSQVSIFVIVAIAILVAILILILFQTKIVRLGGNAVPGDIKEINSIIEDCVKKSAGEAVYFIGDSGGYYFLPNLSTDNKVAYYYYNKNNYMPTKEKIENELSEFMNDALFLCTKNFVDFPDYEVKSSEINTSAKILDDRITFKIKYPLSIKKGDKTYSLENFETDVKIRLGVIYDSIKKIIDGQMKIPDVCLGCITDIAIENNLYINMMDYEDSVIFGVYDLENDLNGEKYVFYFANKYPE